MDLNLKIKKVEQSLKKIFKDCEVGYLYASTNLKEAHFDITSERGLNIAFSQWELLSELFQTNKINSSDFNKSGGCPTCGHGSMYSLTFYIYEIPKNFFS